MNRRLQVIRMSNRSGSHVGCFRFGGPTWEHEFRKFQVCWELNQRGHSFISEGIFNTGDRCDVIDLTAGIIFEIVKSEKKESLASKKEKYPCDFEIRVIDANKVFEPKDLD